MSAPKAFPGASVLQSGMDLRDWFAGQALAGFTALMHDDGDAVLGAADAARAAYNYADAMMAERERQGCVA